MLQFQNAKLYAKLEEKHAQEEEFKARLTKLNRFRDNDRNIISSMNVAWNQVLEGVSVFTFSLMVPFNDQFCFSVNDNSIYSINSIYVPEAVTKLTEI